MQSMSWLGRFVVESEKNLLAGAAESKELGKDRRSDESKGAPIAGRSEEDR
jgi:hypothetical protein